MVSATEVISEGAEGIILESVLEGYAEYYSADLSEKVIRSMADNALKCKYNGGTLPMGYVIDEDRYFQIDPLTAAFVLDAFKRYPLEQSSLHWWVPLSWCHNSRWYPGYGPAGFIWQFSGKDGEKQKDPSRRKAEDNYLLTTKLFCGHCVAYLCGESGTGRKQVYHYYKCVNAKKKKTCKKKSVQKNWLEDLLANETMKIVMDDKAIEAIVPIVMDLDCPGAPR